MTQITFYPLGCADTSLIELQDGRRMLVDYANKRSVDKEDKRCDLPALLKADLKAAGRSSYAVASFTHLDEDHCKGASDFFYFRHAAKYQGDGRHKIDTLWVPAAAITETNLDADAWAIRQEARYRLRQGSGILVFSRPERLRDWFEEEGLSMESRAGCFVDAGKLVPAFNLYIDGVEFFVHSPHARRTDDRGLEDRNGDSLVFQARFREGGRNTDVIFSADVDHTILSEIVRITRWHKNDGRLHWNVYHLPHHCSYKSVGPEKGIDKTVPVAEVKWLCETQGEPDGFIISPSKPIPYKGTPEDEDIQPPHRQAAAYYRADVLNDPKHLLVTMSEPSSTSPKPIVISITADGAVKAAASLLRVGSAAPAIGPFTFPNVPRVDDKPRGFG